MHARLPIRNTSLANILSRLACVLLFGVATAAVAGQSDSQQVTMERLSGLVDGLAPSPLKERLGQCLNQRLRPAQFSIGHRGAPLRYAEHTRESYVAAASQGAGIVECDVTFTKDRQLVCRHSQCDLHSTTNILQTPLAASCRVPFSPAGAGKKAGAQCCTSDITQAQFLTLKGRSDNVNRDAGSIDDYLQGSDRPGGGKHVENATVMTHRQSIRLFRDLGVAMTPELKAPQVDMPFEGSYSQQQYAAQLIEEYAAESVPAADVYPQSFDLEDIRYWLKTYPAFGQQAVYLDGRYRGSNRINPMTPDTFKPSMQALAEMGVQTIAPPMWMLLTTRGSDLIASPYANAANKAGLNIVTWTLERSGTLTNGGGWYYQSVKPQISEQSDMLRTLHALQQAAKIRSIFSDWPATVTFYANCMGLK